MGAAKFRGLLGDSISWWESANETLHVQLEGAEHWGYNVSSQNSCKDLETQGFYSYAVNIA